MTIMMKRVIRQMKMRRIYQQVQEELQKLNDTKAQVQEEPMEELGHEVDFSKTQRIAKEMGDQIPELGISGENNPVA